VTGISKEEWFTAHKVLAAWLKAHPSQSSSDESAQEEFVRVKTVAETMLYTLESDSDPVYIYAYDTQGNLHETIIDPKKRIK
jgi:hypothetical protein